MKTEKKKRVCGCIISPAPKETNNGASERTLEMGKKTECRVIAKGFGRQGKYYFKESTIVQQYNIQSSKYLFIKLSSEHSF